MEISETNDQRYFTDSLARTFLPTVNTAANEITGISDISDQGPPTTDLLNKVSPTSQ